MNATLKKSLLGFAFASAALLTGCSSSPKEKTEKIPSEAEMRQSAHVLYGTYNLEVVSDQHCSVSTEVYNNNCGFELKKKQDDGFIYFATYYPRQPDLNIGGCSFAGNDLGKKNADAAQDAYAQHMRAKFNELGFAVSGSFSSPGVRLAVMGGNCEQYTEARYVLRSNDRIYTAQYGETYHFNNARVSDATVSALEPLDRLPIIAKRTETASNDTSATGGGEGTAHRQKSDDSNICVGLCTGPHIDLRTGKVNLSGTSTGPGYKLK